MTDLSRRKLFGLAAGVVVAPSVAMAAPATIRRGGLSIARATLAPSGLTLTLDDFAARYLEPAMARLATSIEQDDAA